MPIRRTAGIALASLLLACPLLAGCVAETPPPLGTHLDPQHQAEQRARQVNGRIANEHRLIDVHVNQGYYPPPVGEQLHSRLEQVRRKAEDLASRQGGGLSSDEQRALNEELNAIAAQINR